MFPYYLAIGMTPEQFWDSDPKLATAYRKAYDIKRRRTNEELWLAGIYTSEALAATVGNMFSKTQKYKYPSEPKAITESELQERKERERRAKMEDIKRKFTARALAVNAEMGAKK